MANKPSMPQPKTWEQAWQCICKGKKHKERFCPSLYMSEYYCAYCYPKVISHLRQKELVTYVIRHESLLVGGRGPLSRSKSECILTDHRTNGPTNRTDHRTGRPSSRVTSKKLDDFLTKLKGTRDDVSAKGQDPRSQKAERDEGKKKPHRRKYPFSHWYIFRKKKLNAF